MVIAAHMQHLVAHAPIVLVADARSPVAHFLEVGELLCVQVEEITRSCVLVAVRRLLRLEIRGPGDPGLPQPETNGGSWNVQVSGDMKCRLAPQPSTYGLDDEAKLVASRQSVGLA